MIRYAGSGELSYGTSFSSFGDGCQIAYFEPAAEDFHEKLQAFRREAKTSLTMGYLFDTEGLAAEIAAVSSVVSEYRPILETGMADNVQELLDEFNAALKEAEIEKIIDENSYQLNQWLKKRQTTSDKSGESQEAISDKNGESQESSSDKCEEGQEGKAE